MLKNDWYYSFYYTNKFIYIYFFQNEPSRHMTSIQRRLNVDASIDVETTLYKRQVPTGNSNREAFRKKKNNKKKTKKKKKRNKQTKWLT